ncbi:signal recognition particle 9 kDa protein-domain-containing protein [Schizothecium vesticola]|uniref:Signal recognition particle 9 kDa protein-domain-containing protein n=1 Tax=Schizothecium vesticola TaxID=314040 RepID=A0AA40F8K0_9PEZI|nr:signal recognition particle 9 kDa protein-domain-containing protein [Schizothecium vesticola]
MPYYPKSEDWLHHSSLLLQAYPETTRITTRYHISPARRPSKAERAAHKAAANPATGTYPPRAVTTEGEAKPPRGHLVLKTFDPTSGVSLKYKTSKAAEVGRLVQMLGVLGRRMGGWRRRRRWGARGGGSRGGDGWCGGGEWCCGCGSGCGGWWRG